MAGSVSAMERERDQSNGISIVQSLMVIWKCSINILSFSRTYTNDLMQMLKFISIHSGKA